MSLRLSIDKRLWNIIHSELTIVKQTQQRSGRNDHDSVDDKIIQLFEVCKDNNGNIYHYLPLSYAIRISGVYVSCNNIVIDPIERWIKATYECNIELRQYQIEPYRLARQQLRHYRYCFVKGGCGTGKTTFGILLSHDRRYRSMILVHRDSIGRGWVKAFTKHTRARVCFVEDDLDPDADIYICMIMRVRKFTRAQLSCIGTLIVDEAKYLCTPVWSRLLLKIQPRYIVGLCAEDNNKDGTDVILNHMYGSERIIMKNSKPFMVVKYETTFQPRIELHERGKFKGRPKWNIVEDTVYNNVKRCWLISCVIARESVDHKSIAICRLKLQATTIHDMLSERLSCDSALLIGKQKTCRNSRVLITNRSKASVGFDAENFIPDYDGEPIQLVFMCMSVRMIEQSKGRGDRSSLPMICMFVDNYHTFQKHYNENEKWLTANGGTVTKLSLH